MVNRFDLGFVIKQTLATICKRIDLPKISFILFDNSYLLYQCLFKLGTTSEKWLIFDLMVFRESYNR